MFVNGLDHYNVSTDDLPATRHFYCDILGLNEGYRPPLVNPGAWFYANGHPIVHINADMKIGSRQTGAFDHVAFQATGDPAALAKKLDSEGIKYERRVVPKSGIRQLFCLDPNGVKVEFNFPPA